MIDKIKNELRRRLEASEDGMIEIAWYIDAYDGLFGYKPDIAA